MQNQKLGGILTDASNPQDENAPAMPVGGKDRPRFALIHGDQALDPRIHAFRNDVADIALADRVVVPHYVTPVFRQVTKAKTDLLPEPSGDTDPVSQLLWGEEFAVLDLAEDWAWGYGLHDHYVGYVATDALGPVTEVSHKVAAPSTALRSAASADAPETACLPMGSRVSGTIDGDWLATVHGWLAAADVRAINDTGGDPVDFAEALLGTPYLFGGRSVDGIDCSGLVQIALGLTGRSVARDSDLQQSTIGEALADDAILRRGDLIFFPDHVGLMADTDMLVHASHGQGSVSREPLLDVVARMAAEHDTAVLLRRRIAG